MKQHLNTLFVFTQDAYLAKDGQAVAVRVEREVKLRIPIHNLGSIVCFGRVGLSPALMALAGEMGVAISLCTQSGRFLARISGFTPGNVLLRREQYRWADDPSRTGSVVQGVLIGKLANSRSVLQRAAREQRSKEAATRLGNAATRIEQSLDSVRRITDPDKLRGIEGEAAATYFDVFNDLILATDPDWRFGGRTRRPPLDRANALLSFLYAMLAHDARAACEAAGLDPAVGFLHRDRPGRPGLALDLMEELRPILADRVALSLVNRHQLRATEFIVTESGAVSMTEAARRTAVTEYQSRKQDVTTHPFLQEKTTVGLLVHLQARLLSRLIRGELDAYPALIMK